MDTLGPENLSNECQDTSAVLLKCLMDASDHCQSVSYTLSHLGYIGLLFTEALLC